MINSSMQRVGIEQRSTRETQKGFEKEKQLRKYSFHWTAEEERKREEMERVRARHVPDLLPACSRPLVHGFPLPAPGATSFAAHSDYFVR